jgi:YfiH family protein
MFKETDLGFCYQAKNHFVFFGKKNCTIENLKKVYPSFEFRQTKQTHSDILIQSIPTSESTEADAHFTIEENVALVIRTADCIPALIYNADLDLVLAVHAGWRGVENKILLKSLKHLILSKNLNIYVGPHILQNSFQVDLEVKNKLQPTSDQFYEKENKFYIDLKSILTQQIQTFAEFKMSVLEIDTQSDLRLNSFRRDKEKSGRNLSFIVKTNA